jgi:hypothetical protein
VLHAALFLLGALAAPAQAEQCRAASGPATAALVELYTSEGCSSCPPADRWLSALSKRYPAERVVPIALHVDYWDYIGWKDRYAKREFSLRQRKLSQLQRLALVYTPQVLVGGADFRPWYGPEFDRAVAAINARPARARIELEIVPATSRTMALKVRASVMEADGALYLAAYENRLRSRVSAGENRGRTLDHDHVVLDWQGPIAFDAGGRLDLERELPLLPEAVPENSGVVAFVQNRRTAEVLQALALPACAAPTPAR